MGLDVNRFLGGTVDEELLCPICSGVLENPVQVTIKILFEIMIYKFVLHFKLDISLDGSRLPLVVGSNPYPTKELDVTDGPLDGNKIK